MDNQTIGDRLRSAMGDVGENELARRSGVPQSTIHRILVGESRDPRFSNLEKLAKALNISAIWLSTGKELQGQLNESNPSYVLLPIEEWDEDTPLDDETLELVLYKSAEFQSGHGRSQQNEVDDGSRLRFGKRTLRKARVDRENAAGGLNRGKSNEPVIPDGAIVMMDRSKTQIIEGELYGLDHLGDFRAKLLYPLPGGGLRLRSYNREEFPDEDFGPDWPEKIRIIGWVWTHMPPIRKWRGR